MNDNLTRYFAIQKALKSLRPTEPKGNVATKENKKVLGSERGHHNIVVRKRFGNPLTLKDVEPTSDQYRSVLKFSREEPESYKHSFVERQDVQERPIMVLIWELARTAYEGPDYFDEEDFRRREWYYVRLFKK